MFPIATTVSAPKSRYVFRNGRRSNRVGLLLFVALSIALVSKGAAQPDRSSSQIAAIASALRSRDFQVALDLSRSELQKNPGDYRVWTSQGLALTAMGQPSRAGDSYRRALRLAPNYVPALEGAAQTEFLLGRTDAESLLKRIMAQRSGDLFANATLGIIEANRGNCREAIDHFERARSALGHYGAALSEFGSCLSLMNRHEEAIEIFNEVLAHAPTRPEARYNLALAQRRAGNLDEALSTLEPMVGGEPADPGALELGSEILEAKGKTPEAIVLLRKAIAADPKRPSPYLEFASLSFDHASLTVGIDILNFGLRQMPRNAQLYLARGILLAELGDLERAAEDFDQADRVDPRVEFVGVAEGLLQSERHEPTAAISRFREAVKAHPDDSYAHYLLAEALLFNGDSQMHPVKAEALKEAERAARLDPHSAEALDLLSAIYMETGDSEKAIKASRAALELDPNDEQAVFPLIIDLRKTKAADQIPGLVKRLIEIRASNKDKQTSDTAYRLFEGTGRIGFSDLSVLQGQNH